MNLLFDLPPNYKVVREGKENGENWIFRIKTCLDREITAVAVTQPTVSRTGPTWSYVFENNGLNTVDVGSPGSFDSLKDGYKAAGITLTDIQTCFVSHGHADHDGTIPEFISESKSDLYAHESYGFLKSFKSWDIQDFTSTVLQREFTKIVETKVDKKDLNQKIDSSAEYYKKKQEINVTVGLKHRDVFGDIEVYSTPGHSPDQICLAIDDVVFTGDHVLPEITPHPTTKMNFKKSFINRISKEAVELEALYGLKVYLESLGYILHSNEGRTLLPAHRLYNRSTLNIIDTERARAIIDHHSLRLARLLRNVISNSSSLEDLTKGLFSKGELSGANMVAALSEVVAHLEFLEDVGDIVVTEDGIISVPPSAKPNYKSVIDHILKGSNGVIR